MLFRPIISLLNSNTNEQPIPEVPPSLYFLLKSIKYAISSWETRLLNSTPNL